MIIEQVTDLGDDAIKFPKKYKGFMGVSIRNNFFSKDRMRDFIRWGAKQFEVFHILLIDDPDRVNIQVFKAMNAEQSLIRARELAGDAKTAFQRIVNQYRLTNVEIIQFQDFSSTNEYKTILKSVNNYIKKVPAFKLSLWGVMQTAIGGKILELAKADNLSSEQVREVEKKLFTYAIEEFATLIYITEHVATIEIDPHIELKTKSEIYSNLFPSIIKNLPLKQRGHIFVSTNKNNAFVEQNLA